MSTVRMVHITRTAKRQLEELSPENRRRVLGKLASEHSAIHHYRNFSEQKVYYIRSGRHLRICYTKDGEEGTVVFVCLHNDFDSFPKLYTPDLRPPLPIEEVLPTSAELAEAGDLMAEPIAATTALEDVANSLQRLVADATGWVRPVIEEEVEASMTLSRDQASTDINRTTKELKTEIQRTYSRLKEQIDPLLARLIIAEQGVTDVQQSQNTLQTVASDLQDLQVRFTTDHEMHLQHALDKKSIRDDVTALRERLDHEWNHFEDQIGAALAEHHVRIGSTQTDLKAYAQSHEQHTQKLSNRLENEIHRVSTCITDSRQKLECLLQRAKEQAAEQFHGIQVRQQDLEDRLEQVPPTVPLAQFEEAEKRWAEEMDAHRHRRRQQQEELDTLSEELQSCRQQLKDLDEQVRLMSRGPFTRIRDMFIWLWHKVHRMLQPAGKMQQPT